VVCGDRSSGVVSRVHNVVEVDCQVEEAGLCYVVSLVREQTWLERE